MRCDDIVNMIISSGDDLRVYDMSCMILCIVCCFLLWKTLSMCSGLVRAN